jgi:Na+-driven multidrug efflux pump
MVVSYSNQAIAGMGIAKKIDILAFAIANGMTQGVLPLIGYNFAAKNHKRMREVIKTAFLYTLVVSAAGTLLLFFGAVPLVRFFIDDAETVAYGQYFLKVIAITCCAISVTMMIITIFQATGSKIQPMILSLVRKGGFDIPLMFIMNSTLGSQGIPWATPISDAMAMVLALLLFVPYWRKLRNMMKEEELSCKSV